MASEDLPANGHGGPADPNPAPARTAPARTAPARTALRRRLRAARAGYVAGLDPATHDRLEADLAAVIAGHLPPGIVAGYTAMGSEIGPHRVPRITLLPEVAAGAPLTFRAVDGLPGVPDIVLVPLIAVDRTGTRLGQGGGHYDRTLAALRAARPVLAVGVAWDMQRVDELPAEPWDEPLDALATPSEWIDFAPSPRREFARAQGG